MDAKSHSGNPYITTAVYYLSFICLGMATAVLGPTLQGLAKNTDATLARISSLFLLSSFGYLLGSISAGRIFDRVKGHPALALALVIVAFMMGSVPLVATLLVLQIIFFIIGIAEGNLDVGANTLIVWLHGERVPPFMNGLHAFYGIGSTIAPIIVALVISSSTSFSSIYWILALLMLPVALAFLFLPSPSHILSRQQAEERPALPIFVLLIAVVFFAITGAELGFGGWIYTYTTSQNYGNPTLAASINAAFWAALTVGRVMSVPISVKLKPQQMIWINFSGVILSLLIIIFFSASKMLLWIGTLGMGLFMASTFPTLLNDAQSRMHLSGNVTSKFFIGASLGSMFVPWLIGQLIGPFGANVIMMVIMASTLLGAGIYYLLNAKQRSTADLHPSV